MNYIDLFSGIGGFALGSQWAGIKWDKHYYSDIDEYANKVYKLRFPAAVALGDITQIDFEELKYGNEWVITGGFPCQDISIAGKGAGIEGKRSGLWSEYFTAIRILRPRFAIIENVSAITFRGLDRVLADLAEIGYDAEWQNIRAKDMGAPHKRERIWIVAYPMQCGRGNSEKERQVEKIQGDRLGNSSIQQREIPNTDGKRCKNSSKRYNKISKFRCKNKKRKESYRSWWSVESSVGRLVNGLPYRVDRLKCLGNSIVPQIAQLLFEQIKDKLF